MMDEDIAEWARAARCWADRRWIDRTAEQWQEDRNAGANY